jgi:hypothetical protein
VQIRDPNEHTKEGTEGGLDVAFGQVPIGDTSVCFQEKEIKHAAPRRECEFGPLVTYFLPLHEEVNCS